MNKEAGAAVPASQQDQVREISNQPREILRELLVEETVENASELADLIIGRLGSKGFFVWPYAEFSTETNDLKQEIERLKDAKRRAMQMADLRSREATVLRAENAELRRRRAS
jgi:hypothetical protein